MKALATLTVVALLMAASGVSGYTLNETWRLPLGLAEVGQFNYLPLTAVGDVLVASDNMDLDDLAGMFRMGQHVEAPLDLLVFNAGFIPTGNKTSKSG